MHCIRRHYDIYNPNTIRIIAVADICKLQHQLNLFGVQEILFLSGGFAPPTNAFKPLKGPEFEIHLPTVKGKNWVISWSFCQKTHESESEIVDHNTWLLEISI